MIEIKNKHIYISRGDTGTFKVRRLDKITKEPIPFSEGDIVYFTVKTSTKTDDILIQEIVTSFDEGYACIRLESHHTNDLKYKKYVYDIQVNTKEGDVDTIVKPGDGSFTVGPEVTYD